jgi:flagellar hook-basal body protein
LNNFSDPATPSTQVYIDPIEGRQITTGMPIMFGAVSLAAAQGNAFNAWEQQPPVPPAHVSASVVYDSLGNQRSITIQYYQVNDLGTAVPPVNTPPMNQVLYAWYAFDTTGGAAVSNATLIGGTGIIEGDASAPAAGAGPGYDRGVAGDEYWGDFIWFNTDGSLGSLGAVLNQGVASAARPAVYLPPTQDDYSLGGGPGPASPIPNIGAEVTRVYLDFGTAGLLGGPGVQFPGLRDGMYGDAEGTYQFINGVNTYVPNHTAYIKEQDGYRDGQLLGVSFDKLGTIVGSFSNGENVALARLVMAMPDNQEGLSKVGGNYYATSANSGPMFLGQAGQLGVGTIQGNALEGSNVDLTIELSNMIIAQRGFEVNARVISVTNSTLETVTRLGQ